MNDGITLRYWAAAKAAAGTGSDTLAADAPVRLDEVVRRAVELHPGTNLASVLQVCSTLIGDRPVSSEDPAGVLVRPGDCVEFLPPFAGG